MEKIVRPSVFLPLLGLMAGAFLLTGASSVEAQSSHRDSVLAEAQRLRARLGHRMNCGLGWEEAEEGSAGGDKATRLSPTWAQEAIGLPETLDLLEGSKLHQIPVGVVDASFSQVGLAPDGAALGLFKVLQREREDWASGLNRAPHGTNVANLMISNPSTSSGLNSLLTWFTFLTESEEDDSFVESVYSAGVGPRVVNISMGHRRRFSLSDVDFARNEFQKLLDRLSQVLPEDVIFVKSAGNDFGEPLSLFGNMERPQIPHVGAVLVEHRRLAPRLVSVASVDSTGFVSSFSSGGEDVLISAPGGYPMQSGTQEQPSVFGGTSASAPLVAGAISTALSLQPGLTFDELQELLVRSAVPIRGQPVHPGYGGNGSLNLYKLTLMVTKKTASWLPWRALDSMSDGQIRKLAQNHLAAALDKDPGVSCQVKREVLGSLRRAYFLDPGDPLIRWLLGTAYKSEGYLQQAIQYGPESFALMRERSLRDSLGKHILYLAQTQSPGEFLRRAGQVRWLADRFTLDKLMELAELRGDVELFELLLMNNALGFSKEDIFHHASRARLSIAPLEHLLATDFEFVASQPLHFALSSLVRKGSAQAVRSILPLFLQSSLHPQRVLENMHRQALESGNIETAALLQSHLF